MYRDKSKPTTLSLTSEDLGLWKVSSLSMAQGQRRSKALLPPLPARVQTKQSFLNNCLRYLLSILAWRWKNVDSKYKGCCMNTWEVGSLACREMGVGPKFFTDLHLPLLTLFAVNPSRRCWLLRCNFGLLGYISQWFLYCGCTQALPAALQ